MSPHLPAGLNHVSLMVPDLDEARDIYERQWGFEAASERSDVVDREVLLRQAAIVLRLTQPAAGTVEFERSTRRGIYVHDVALACANPAATFDWATSNGALAFDRDSCRLTAFGDVTFSLVTALPDGLAVPGFGILDPPTSTGPAGLRTLDHFAVCVMPGQLSDIVSRACSALGFTPIFEEKITVGDQAMMSRVIRDGSGTLTFTFLEPDPLTTSGQIASFLERNGGPGVQHLAFSCDDIIAAVATVEANGARFLATPDAYYDRLSAHAAPDGHTIAQLRHSNVLVDRDERGEMFQIFARAAQPSWPMFFELIERAGAATFGTNNIRALYEAVQADAVNQQ